MKTKNLMIVCATVLISLMILSTMVSALTPTPVWHLAAPPTSAFDYYVGQYTNGTYYCETGSWQSWANNADANVTFGLVIKEGYTVYVSNGNYDYVDLGTLPDNIVITIDVNATGITYTVPSGGFVDGHIVYLHNGIFVDDKCQKLFYWDGIDQSGLFSDINGIIGAAPLTWSQISDATDEVNALISSWLISNPIPFANVTNVPALGSYSYLITTFTNATNTYYQATNASGYIAWTSSNATQTTVDTINAMTTGQTLLFCTGTFPLHGIKVKSGITIEGVSEFGTILQLNVNSRHIIESSDVVDTTPIDNFVLKTLTLDGNKATYASGGSCIYGCFRNSTFSNVHAINSASDNILMTEGGNYQLLNMANKFDCVTSKACGGNAISFANSTDDEVIGGEYGGQTDLTYPCGGSAMYFGGPVTGGITVTGAYIGSSTLNNIRIEVAGVIKFVGCEIDAAHGGDVYIKNSSRNIISNCNFVRDYSDAVPCIYLLNSNHNVIEGNQFSSLVGSCYWTYYVQEAQTIAYTTEYNIITNNAFDPLYISIAPMLLLNVPVDRITSNNLVADQNDAGMGKTVTQSDWATVAPTDLANATDYNAYNLTQNEVTCTGIGSSVNVAAWNLAGRFAMQLGEYVSSGTLVAKVFIGCTVWQSLSFQVITSPDWGSTQITVANSESAFWCPGNSTFTLSCPVGDCNWVQINFLCGGSQSTIYGGLYSLKVINLDGIAAYS